VPSRRRARIGLSVLTDERFFQGSLEYLRQIRAAVGLPLLRKDFIIDERQILEAAEWGADAILLIVAILTDAQLEHFHALAAGAGLAVLVETHDETELERALACGARLIGVNNRDLKTFTVDLAATERLAARLPARKNGREVLLVSESGIRDRKDVARLARSGASAILVGESLTREKNIAAKNHGTARSGQVGRARLCSIRSSIVSNRFLGGEFIGRLLESASLNEPACR